MRNDDHSRQELRAGRRPATRVWAVGGGVTAVHDGDLGEGGSCEFLGLCLRKVVRDFVSCLLFQADVDVKG